MLKYSVNMAIWRKVFSLNDFLIIQFSSFKCIGNQIRRCRKIGHGQPRIIIYINFDELEPLMLIAKLTMDSREDFFKGCMVAISVM